MTTSHRFYKCLNIVLPVAIFVCATVQAGAQGSKQKTLAICEINPIPALAEQIQQDGRKNGLDKVVQSLDSKLISSIAKTGKFSIQAHTALPAILRGGAFDAGTMKDKLDLDYVLVVTINDFGDKKDTGENNIVFRNIRLSGIAQIYNIRTGSLVEPANIEVTSEDLLRSSRGDTSDKLLDLAGNMASGQVAKYVASAVFPPKVVNVDETTVTIGWGNGMPIAKGDVWEVCAVKSYYTNDVGLIKPILKPVGNVTITRVDSDDSTGEINGKDNGISKDCVLRKP